MKNIFIAFLIQFLQIAIVSAQTNTQTEENFNFKKEVLAKGKILKVGIGFDYYGFLGSNLVYPGINLGIEKKLGRHFSFSVDAAINRRAYTISTSSYDYDQRSLTLSPSLGFNYFPKKIFNGFFAGFNIGSKTFFNYFSSTNYGKIDNAGRTFFNPNLVFGYEQLWKKSYYVTALIEMGLIHDFLIPQLDDATFISLNLKFGFPK